MTVRTRDAGATSLEYGALILVGAFVLGAFAFLLVPQGQFAREVDSAICRLFEHDEKKCEKPGDQDLKPSACTTSSSTRTYGASVDIAVFTIGQDLTFIRSTDSTGKVTVTAVDGTSFGVGFGVGAGFNFGKSVNVGADAGAKFGFKVGIGDSWIFDDEDEADRFIGQIKNRAKYKAMKKNPITWSFGKGMEQAFPAKVPDSHIARREYEYGETGSVVGGIDFGPPSWDVKVKPHLNAYLAVDAKAKSVVEKDKRDGSSSVTVELTGGGKAGGAYVIDNKEFIGQIAGSLKLTFDRNGKLSTMTLTRTTIVNGTLTATTTEVPITTDAERAAFDRYLRGDLAQVGTAIRLTWDDMAPVRDPGPDATPLQRLLHTKGRTQRVDYAYSSSDLAYGARIKLGLKLGVNVSIQKRDQSATKGEYLGAPGPDGARVWKPFKECTPKDEDWSW
ncbi:hypothetical protein [Spirillospora sp. CA-294931]|uniref:hypothetical protein n=1 Tax=Spirillospora sp. CA-294931 TaxID=3240042 RepID=UPI003D8F158F